MMLNEDLIKELREAKAFETTEVKDDGRVIAEVVECELSQRAANVIEKQDEQLLQLQKVITQLRNNPACRL